MYNKIPWGRWVYRLWIAVILLFVTPVLLLISLVLWIAQGPPVFFRQKRIGKNGIPFIMYKFRTMNHGAQQKQKELTPLNEAHGPVFKIHNDPRYTPIGKFLAHTGLDELPQLYNILRGDMSLIGPRPLPEYEVTKITASQRRRHEIKPGIISPWILNGYHKQPFGQWMKSDVEYARHKNLGYDIRLTVRTVGFLIRLFIRECASVIGITSS